MERKNFLDLGGGYINISALNHVLFYITIAFIPIKAATLTGLLASSRSAGFTKKDTDQAIIERVHAFWSSEDFLTCLKTAVPKGNKDDHNGFDYVPYMLQNIDLRRQRYRASAHYFLFATVLFAISFSAIVVIFGYFIIDDRSTGLPGAVYKLDNALAVASKDSELLNH